MFSSILNLLALSATVSYTLAAPTTDIQPSNIVTRQAAEAIEATVEVASFIWDVVTTLQDDMNAAHDQESQFTQDTVAQIAAQYPTKNVLMFHDQDSWYELYGAEHEHVEFDLEAPLGTMGYEVWIFDYGSFQRAGDGGYLNWAIAGNFEGTGTDGGVVFYQR